MAFSGISSKIMVLARELIHLHGEEINFRNPVELEVPPSNWPDPSTCSIASTCEEWPGNDYGRISIQSHRDTFSLEVTQSIQRLERIAELEGISIVKCRANQILDKTLQSFNLSDGNVISTGKNNISEKCRRILVEGAKQQNPELFRKPDETIAIEMVTDVDSNGHIESTVILPVPVNISLVQMLDRLEARFNETVGKRPMQRGLWKYATQTGEVIGLLSDAKLKHTMKLFKHSKATPIFWRNDIFRAASGQIAPERKPLKAVVEDDLNQRQWMDYIHDPMTSPVTEDGMPFFSPHDEMPQKLEDYPESMIQTLRQLAYTGGTGTSHRGSESYGES